jgi:predicted NAD/FAD-binding protein
MAKIAVIGTGISGLGAASLLHAGHDITVYEKSAVIGGHTRTKIVDYRGTPIAVDTGFIVFNYRNYPLLSALFKHLGVPVCKSTMSFGVTAQNGALEWGAENLNAVFGQRSNFLNPRFLRFLFDILRFNARAVGFVAKHPRHTLGQMVEKMNLSEWFSRYYILPMGGAIWSCSLEIMLAFPAKTFVDFFDAHGLLTVTQQPQWYTVTGGSQEYVKRLTAPFADRIRTSCAAVAVTRTGGKVQVSDSTGQTHVYDQVVFACHGDETLALLQDASAEERAALGAFTYQKNHAVTHADASLMPKRKKCWASWIYNDAPALQGDGINITYWMNHLQGIDKNYPLFVTLNPSQPIADELVFDRHDFTHPVYSQAAVDAQGEITRMQGQRNTWFCGAYLYNGFHEDGLKSAVHVARQLGAEVPWL